MHHRRNEINIPNLILNSYCVVCFLIPPAEFLFSSQANCSARLSPPVKLWATLARNTLFSRALPFSLVCCSLHHHLLLLLPTLGTRVGSVPDRIGEWVMRRIVYSVSPRQSLFPHSPCRCRSRADSSFSRRSRLLVYYLIRERVRRNTTLGEMG